MRSTMYDLAMYDLATDDLSPDLLIHRQIAKS